MRHRSLRLNTLIHLLGGVVTAGGNLLLAPVYLRLLNSSDYGAWSRYMLAVQVLQPMLCWGLMATMTRLLADADGDRRPRLLSAGFRLASGLNLVAIALILCAWPLWHHWVADAVTARLLLVAAAVAALSAYPAMLMGLHVADNDALHYRGIGLSGFCLQVAMLALATALVQLDVQGAALAMLLAVGLNAALAMWRLWPRQAGARAQPADYLALLAFGVPVLLYAVAGQASDFLIRGIVAARVSRVDFGAFSAGLLFASVIAMVASAANLAWVPLYYRKAKEWTDSGVYNSFVEVFAASTALVACFLIVFSDELLAAYSGGRVQLTVFTVGGLTIAAWLNSAVWMGLSNPLFQQQRTRTVLTLTLVATVFTLPLALFLVSSEGLLGAAWSLAISALLLCGLAAVALRRLGLPALNYPRLALQLLLLVALSGPWLNGLYLQDPGWTRWAGKALLMAGASVLVAALYLRRGLQVLKQIESEIAF